MKLLLKNCDILTRENGEYKFVKNGFLGIDGKLIDYVGKDAQEDDYDASKDMRGALLIPGLVNAHCHSPMTLLRGAGSGLPLDRWLNEAIFPIEADMTPEDIRAGTQLAMMEMLAGGVTLFSDMYDFPWATAEAAAEAGMKCNLGRVMLCFDPSLPGDKVERIDECISFYKAFNDTGEGLIRADFIMHSEYLTTENSVRRFSELIHEFPQACVNIHVSETRKEHKECIDRHGLTPVAYFEKMGILDLRTYMAHCVWINDEDMDIMKAKDVTLVHNPSSNLKLGSGVAPIPKALGKGIRVALGTDGTASNNNLNMFEEMHFAAMLHRGVNMDPAVMSDSAVMDMATVNGAYALRREDTGELVPGKAADICAVRQDSIHMYPNLDTLALLLYSAQASDVVMTMVDGKILYENGEFTTIDREQVFHDMEKALTRLGL